MEKMTRDEALEILDHNWTRLVNPDYTDEELGKAQNMAIEALEKAKKREETWEWCTDCKEYDQENHCCHRLNNVIHDTLCGTIVSGEWIPHETKVPWGDGTTDVTIFRCSICGYEQDWQSRFCPTCGSYNND